MVAASEAVAEEEATTDQSWLERLGSAVADAVVEVETVQSWLERLDSAVVVGLAAFVVVRAVEIVAEATAEYQNRQSWLERPVVAEAAVIVVETVAALVTNQSQPERHWIVVAVVVEAVAVVMKSLQSWLERQLVVAVVEAELAVAVVVVLLLHHQTHPILDCCCYLPVPELEHQTHQTSRVLVVWEESVPRSVVDADDVVHHIAVAVVVVAELVHHFRWVHTMPCLCTYDESIPSSVLD